MKNSKQEVKKTSVCIDNGIDVLKPSRRQFKKKTNIKSCGINGIGAENIKYAGDHLKQKLCIWRNEYLPKIWKGKKEILITCYEQDMSAVVVFIYMRKAYDLVDREIITLP